MYVQTKNERKERHWISFLLLLFVSIVIIFFIINNNSLKIKTKFHYGHTGFLYLFDIKLYILIITVIFNYGNIYQTLLLFYSLLFPNFVHSIYCIFKKYLEHQTDNINEENLLYQYFLIFFFFMVLFHIFFYKRKTESNEGNNMNYKAMFLYIIIFLFLLFCVTNTIAILNSNIIFLDKIISGFLFSFSCYYFIFFVINVYPNDSLQLYYFIDYINNNLVIVSFFIFIILSFYLMNNNTKYIKFLSIILYLNSMIIPIFGIKNELKNIFNSNRKNWINYNFESERKGSEENENMNSLISEISITKPIKWNETSFIVDILRLIALILIKASIFYCSDIINDKIVSNSDEYDVNSASLFYISSIFIFVIDKIILKWIKLINMTYFFLERNSINSG
jgi:hypothetical protein